MDTRRPPEALAVTPVLPAEHQAALADLLAEADGQTGKIPPLLVAEQVLRVTAGGDLALRRAALEALLRRFKSMKSAGEGWRVVEAPRGKAAVGAHRIEVAKGRVYQTVVHSFADLSGSCSCPDFERSSLGLCKHLLWLFQRGVGPKGKLPAGNFARPLLAWDPVRPLTGPGDWLERVRWNAGEVPQQLRRRHRLVGGGGEVRSAFADEPARRLELVRALRGATPSIDPALSGLLAREEARLVRQVDDGIGEKELARALAGLKRPLFPYQREGVVRFLRARRLLLADDMGLGKTAQAIASCAVLHATGKVARGLVIVPAALKPQWLREWRSFTDAPAAILEGNGEARARLLEETTSGFLIANYEQVLRDLPALLRFAPGLVVLDEAQRIKNWAAKTSLYVKRLEPEWRLVLSGTPLENRLTELASLLDWVDDLALEPKWRLTEWHTVRSAGAKGEAIGAKNLDTLRARLAPCSLRRIRKEVLAQLPPRTDIRVPVPLTDEQAEAHAELDQPIAQLLSVSRRRPLTQAEFLRLMSFMTQQRIICNGLAQRDFEETWPGLAGGARPSEATLRGLFSPKLVELRDLLGNLVVTQARKVVVFSQWKRMLRLAEWAVSDLLGDGGLKAVHFTGDESQRRRTENVVEFHEDPRTRVFFATDAGGVGLNLQHAASACVHLDLPWNPAVLEQRSGRIYRLGQKSPVEIYALVSASGIESRIAAIVGDKKALFDGLFDGASDEVRFEKGGSFMPTLPDGRMRLETSPEAAKTFAAMLEGVAGLLRQLGGTQR